MIVVLIELEMENAKEMSSSEREIHIKHSIRNIRRSIVLITRATKTLSFSNKSLEETGDTEEMIEEINDSKRFLGDAIGRLSKYEEDND